MVDRGEGSNVMPEIRKNPTPVVVGLICQDKKVLLGLRPQEGTFTQQNYWEFPGGKIEWGESPKTALQRELKEELDIEAQIGPLKLAHSYIYSPNRCVLLLFYEVHHWKGLLKNCYHLQLKWVFPEELSDHCLLPANQSILPDILSILSPAQ